MAEAKGRVPSLELERLRKPGFRPEPLPRAATVPAAERAPARFMGSWASLGAVVAGALIVAAIGVAAVLRAAGFELSVDFSPVQSYAVVR